MAKITLRPSAFLLTLLSAIPAIGQAAGSPIISTTTASLSNLRIELIDLAPNDGIAPSITFTGGAYLSGSGIPVYDADGQPITPAPVYSNTLLPSSTITNTLNNGATTVTASPTGVEIKTQLTYDDLKNSGYENSSYSYFMSANLEGRTNLNLMDPTSPISSATFTLSPHTLAIVRGTVSNSWSLDAQAVADVIDPKYTSWSVGMTGGPNVNVALYGTEQFADINGQNQGNSGSFGGANEYLSVYENVNTNWDAPVDGTWPLKFNQSINDFKFSIANVDDLALTGMAQLDIGGGATYNLSGYGELPPIDPGPIIPPIDPGPIVPGVPEPGTYVLMGLGLVGITLVRRQRR